jgi:hypothetical protein
VLLLVQQPQKVWQEVRCQVSQVRLLPLLLGLLKGSPQHILLSSWVLISSTWQLRQQPLKQQQQQEAMMQHFWQQQQQQQPQRVL